MDAQQRHAKRSRKQLSFSKTSALRRFLQRIGKSTFRLHTICVGLECIASGGGHQAALHLSWVKPKSGTKARQVADAAREFACQAALVLASDKIDAYFKDLVEEPWLLFPSNVGDVVLRKTTRSKREGGAHSVAERAEAICKHLGLTEQLSVAALDLLSKWRNLAAHSTNGEAIIDADRAKILRGASEQLARDYHGFDIERAIAIFLSKKPPTADHVVTLVALAVRLVRKIDIAAIAYSAGSAEKMMAAADKIVGRHFLDRARSKHSIRGELDKLAKVSPVYRRNMLKEILVHGGLSDSQRPASAVLDSAYIGEVAMLSPEEFADRFLVR